MKEIKDLDFRMYCLVLYNISPIQQGIQSLHAALEYANEYSNTEEFKQYMRCKTVILLNGGTSNSGEETYYGYDKQKGSMELHFEELVENNVCASGFLEPDLNYSITSIAFLVDERVYNKEEYPDLLDYMTSNDIINSAEYIKYKLDYDKIKEDYPKEYNNWLNLIGGEKNEFLKQFLKQFRLA